MVRTKAYLSRNDAGAIAAAKCKLTNNKGTWYVTTPGSAVVQRSYEDLSVSCEKENYLPGLVSVKSSTKGMAFGNILFGGLIGAGVDMSTGAAYDYPTLITVAMAKATANLVPDAASASTPSVAASAPAAVVAANASWAAAKLDESMIVGKTWQYAHPRDEARFGNIKLTFSEKGVLARNSRSRTSGTWALADGVMCAHFESQGWRPICLALEKINGNDMELRDTIGNRMFHAKLE